VNLNNRHIPNDYLLWERFKNGDKLALEEIYKANYSSLFDYGYRILKNSDFVKECIQELFFQLISNIDSLGTPYNIKYYLLASLRRKIFSTIKEERRSTNGSSNPHYSFDLVLSHEDFLIEQENESMRQSEMKKSINNLPAKEKEAIYLRYFKKMSYEEIMRIMGINYDSARKMVYRAIKALRENLSIKINE
jgi:RNA polymerase sigma factor (sigma-70 family)